LECQQVPIFSQLSFLKSLTFEDHVEYMGSSDPLHHVYSSQQEVLFFPSLEELTLLHMDYLKGWWKEISEVVSNDHKDLVVQLPRLHHL